MGVRGRSKSFGSLTEAHKYFYSHDLISLSVYRWRKISIMMFDEKTHQRLIYKNRKASPVEVNINKIWKGGDKMGELLGFGTWTLLLSDMLMIMKIIFMAPLIVLVIMIIEKLRNK